LVVVVLVEQMLTEATELTQSLALSLQPVAVAVAATTTLQQTLVVLAVVVLVAITKLAVTELQTKVLMVVTETLEVKTTPEVVAEELVLLGQTLRAE
jgi:hypothetical protein